MEIPTFGMGRKEEVKQEPKRSHIDAKEYAEKIRRDRKNFNGLELKLSFLGDHPGWKRRWVNDENTPMRLAQGYRFVEKAEIEMSDSLRYGNADIGNRVAYPTGGLNARNEMGMAYLMEIPQEIADDLDKQFSQDQADRIDASIRAGKVGDPGPTAYVPQNTPIRYGTKP